MFKYIVIFVALLFNSSFIFAQADFVWVEESDIYEKIYDANLSFIDGEESSLFKVAEKQPVLVSLIFTRCVGICNPLLFQLKNELDDSNLAENNFKVLVVSFDPRDTLDDMRRYAKLFKLEKNDSWLFAITNNIDELTKSVSFNPTWHSGTQQFEHDALTVGIDTNGYITKKNIGLPNSKDLKLLVNSINHKFIPSYRLPTKSTIFSCFNYNPATGKNTPGFGLLFILSPALLSVVVLLIIRINTAKHIN